MDYVGGGPWLESAALRGGSRQTMMNRFFIFALAVSLSLLPTGTARASDTSDAVIIYSAAAAIIVNGGAAAANGIALLSNNPNRTNGMLGAILGGVSTGAAVVGYIAADGEELEEQYSLVLGALGCASLITGYLNIRAADSDILSGESAERAFWSPVLISEGREGFNIGLSVRIEF